MENNSVSVRSISNVTHDVLKIVTEKPEGWSFTPGQATEVSINKENWKTEKRPFTFTSLPGDDFLEFTIKIYPSHKGVTNELLRLKEADQLILHDVFGTISYQGEGVFIAGGAGVTPFISILRSLKAKEQTGHNKLIFANKTKADIILEHEFSKLLGKNFINILSEEETPGYRHGHITAAMLNEIITTPQQKIYLCGPEPMMEAIGNSLGQLKIDINKVIKEKF